MDERKLNADRKVIAWFIRTQRNLAGMTQNQLANATGLSRKSINEIESGRHWFTMKSYLLIAKALKFNPAKPFEFVGVKK